MVQCPYCGQAISSEEILRKIQSAEQAQANRLRSELVGEWSRKEKELLGQIALAHNQADETIRNAQHRLDEERRKITEDALETAKQDVEGARRNLAEQLEQVESRAAAAERELGSLKQDFQSKLQKAVGETSAQAIEASGKQHEQDLRLKEEQLEKLKFETAKDRFRWQKEIEDLNRRLEKKTADELGQLPERELEVSLRQEFPDDRIERLGKGHAGADLLQNVAEAGEVCGRIVYEVKNTLNWSNDFVEQAKGYRTAYDTPHVILVTRVFPAAERGFSEHDGILIVSHDKVTILARILRQAILELARERAAGQEIHSKATELYEYLRSAEFRERMRAIFGSIERLRSLQEQEERSHKRLWEKQAKEHQFLHAYASDVESKISSVVEGRVIQVAVPKRKS